MRVSLDYDSSDLDVVVVAWLRRAKPWSLVETDIPTMVAITTVMALTAETVIVVGRNDEHFSREP